MHPPTPRRAALVLPAPAPVPVLAYKVTPAAAGKSRHHIAGTIEGLSLNYSDLNAFAWYAGQAGRDLRGARTMFGRRGMRGVEDSDQRKQQ